MKKLILGMVFVFATGTMMNANSSIDGIVNTEIEDIQVLGCASECVSDAREGALEFSEDHTDRGAGGDLMTYYNMFYQSCYDANCGN